MAGWIDLFSFIATFAVFGGVIYGVIFVVKTINEGVASTKESLKAKGLHVTSSGVSVKTSKRFDREDYVDATQRGVVKAMQASSFRRNASASTVPQSMDRTPSSSSSETKKKSVFGTRK